MSNKLISPYTGGEVERITNTVTITFKGEEFTIDIPGYKCLDTENVFATGDMNDEVAHRVQDLWRKKYNIPTVSELINLRKRLGLNKKEMSAFLNLGINQYRYYEKGEVPKGAALLALQLALQNDSSLSHLIALKSKTLPNHTVNAYMDFCNSVFDDINVENTAITIEGTPRVNKSVLSEESLFVEEPSQEYLLSGEAKAVNSPF